MSETCTIKERAARKLLTETGIENGKAMPARKLATALTKLVKNCEDSDELDLSKASRITFGKLFEAAEEGQKIIVKVEDTDTEEEEVVVKKKGKSAKATAKGKKKATRESGEVSKKTLEGQRLNAILEKNSPISVELLAKKAKVTSKRAEGHVKWMRGKGWAVLKKGKVSYTRDK